MLTHGFVLDEKGFKMSKSLGNVIDPKIVIDGGKDAKKEPAFGADVLRLWVASVDYTGDVRIGGNIMNQVLREREIDRDRAREYRVSYAAGKMTLTPNDPKDPPALMTL